VIELKTFKVLNSALVEEDEHGNENLLDNKPFSSKKKTPILPLGICADQLWYLINEIYSWSSAKSVIIIRMAFRKTPVGLDICLVYGDLNITLPSHVP